MEGRDEELIETFIENLKGDDNLKCSLGWKVKQSLYRPGQAVGDPLGLPKFVENRQMNVAWL